MTPGNFPSFYGEQRDRVNQALDRILPPENESRLTEAMRYSTLGGGKRVRGVLVLEAARLGSNPENSLADTVAGAIELLHTYTLVHDDLPAMDDDEMRRGQPACHKKYDEATAILCGNALLTRAFELLGEEIDTDDGKLVSLLGQTGTVMGWSGILEGQQRDLDYEGSDSSEDEIVKMYEKKTGYLIGLALEYGAIAGGLNEKQHERLRTTGRTLGVAFQIRDDLLELDEDVDRIGKESGSDRRQEKQTLAAVTDPEVAREQARKLVDQGRTLLDEFPYDTSRLESLADFLIARSR